jgi:hypothetical protein
MIDDIEFDQTVMERLPSGTVEQIKAYRERLAKQAATTYAFVHEKMGTRLDMPVPHDLRGRKVKVTLEIIE